MPDQTTNKPPKKVENPVDAVNLPPSGSALSAFIVKPKNIHFDTQSDTEDIIFFLRQHFVVNTAWILVTILLILAPLFLLPFLISANIVPSDAPSGYFIVLPLLWYLGVFGYVLMHFLHWYFNIYIVTNERIVDIDWVNILYKQFSATSLDKIQDVTFKQHGIVDLFFNYGNVFIQTAGTEQNFEFHSVPKPDVVVRQLHEVIKNL